MAATEIRSAAAQDREELARILAAAFADDPVFSWVFPGDERRPRVLWPFFGFIATETYVPKGAVYLADGACACWGPPGSSDDWPDERSARFGELMMREGDPGDLERLSVLGGIMEGTRPREPHWYLAMLATVPERQGQGMGAALLRHTLVEADRAQLPAYLESSNPRNVPLYLRHGFEAVGRLDLPDGPSMTTMWRPARV